MAKKVWTDAHTRQLIEMYESKQFSTREMAATLGVTQRTIYNRLGPMNLDTTSLPRRHHAPVKFEFSQAEKTKILNLHAEGKYFSEIAKALGRTIMPIRRICAELGLTTSNFKSVKVGDRFGYLRVVAHAPAQKIYKGHYESKCIVECHCGNQKEAFNSALRSGNTKTCGCKDHLLNPDTPYVRIFHGYLSGAESRGLELKLNLDQIKYLVHQRCFYCQTASSNRVEWRTQGRSNNKTSLKYMGIDRVNSAGHYVPGNVLPACKMCNRAKSNASLSEFVAWLNRLGSEMNEQEILNAAAQIGRILKDQALKANLQETREQPE
jgi:hypothetical protein